MSERIRILQSLLLGGVFCSAGVTAQNQTGWRDYSYIKQSEAWLSSYNAGGLRRLPVDRISVAELYANKQNGGFVNYYQSDNSYNLGARVESFYRLTSRVVFYGLVNYDYFKGKHMGGSAFIDPCYNPFDIVEYTDDCRGEKEKETYHLIGAVSGDLLDNLTIGGKIDYTAANYAKFKDLRHQNKLLDMFVTAGLTYRINTSIEAGANYYYRRSAEGIEFDTYGTTGREYISLIDYGGFCGITEGDGSGYTKLNDEKPMFNEHNGGSLQLSFRITPQLSFFNEFTYQSRNGYYGKRSPSSVVYSEHKGTALEYAGTLSLKEQNNRHQLLVRLSWEELENNQTNYRSETGSAGNSVIVYYDPVKVGDKEFFNAKVEYKGYLGMADFNPRWALNGKAEYYNRKLTASVYPYYRKQTVHYTNYEVNAARNLPRGKNMYTISLGASFLSGGDRPKDDGLYAVPTESQTFPRNSDLYLYREYEYLTNSRFTGEASFKYSRIFDDVNIKGYASIGYKLTKASDVVYLPGDKHHQFCLTIGCTF